MLHFEFSEDDIARCQDNFEAGPELQVCTRLLTILPLIFQEILSSGKQKENCLCILSRFIELDVQSTEEAFTSLYPDRPSLLDFLCAQTPSSEGTIHCVYCAIIEDSNRMLQFCSLPSARTFLEQCPSEIASKIVLKLCHLSLQ